MIDDMMGCFMYGNVCAHHVRRQTDVTTVRIIVSTLLVTRSLENHRARRNAIQRTSTLDYLDTRTLTA